MKRSSNSCDLDLRTGNVVWGRVAGPGRRGLWRGTRDRKHITETQPCFRSRVPLHRPRAKRGATSVASWIEPRLVFFGLLVSLSLFRFFQNKFFISLPRVVRSILP